jgi:hypothetical protein
MFEQDEDAEYYYINEVDAILAEKDKRIMDLLRERMETQHGCKCECDDCLTVKQQ